MEGCFPSTDHVIIFDSDYLPHVRFDFDAFLARYA